MVAITILVPAAAPTLAKYNPPPFGMLFVEPRGVSEVYTSTLLFYAIGTTAMLYYFYRRWGFAIWNHHILQVVAFLRFPMLPVIQFGKGIVWYLQLHHIEEIRIRVPIRGTISKLHTKRILSEKWDGIVQVIDDVSNKNPIKFRPPRIPLRFMFLWFFPLGGLDST